MRDKNNELKRTTAFFFDKFCFFLASMDSVFDVDSS